MDIASLGYEVDSSGLERGTRALDDNVKAAERASDAVETLEDRYRRIAREGVAYAESMRGANLSERAIAEAARETTSAFDSRTAIMANSETTQERLTRRARELQDAEARIAASTEQAARAQQLQELNLKKLLGQIDPTIGRLEHLAQLEGTLEKALDLGVITPEVFQQYQGKIDATRAATLKAGQASEVMTRKLGGLNLQAVETQQSVAALVRSLATGQWGQAQASITSLTARTGIMSAMFSGTGLVIGGVGAIVAGYAAALNSAEKDTSRITNTLAMTGNYVAITAGQFEQLVDSLADLEGITHGGARNALISVAANGRIAGDQFEMVATIAARMEAATGQAIDTTVRKFEEIAKDPVRALLKLNETEHFLTQAHLDRIDALIREGDEQGAAAEAARIYAGRLDEVASAAERARPHLSQMVSEVKKLASSFWDGTKNFTEFLAATAKVTAQRPWWQRMGLAGGFNFLRDMSNAEPASAGGPASVLGAVDSGAEQQRRAEAEKAEQYIQRQIEAMYGLDTAVNRLEMSFAGMSEERQKAMVADGTYTALLNQAMEEDAKRAAKNAEKVREEASAVDLFLQNLNQQYAQQAQAMERQIALHGQVGRAAAVAYDIAHGALANLQEGQQQYLLETAGWLDWLDDMAALESVWESTAAEHKKAMDAGKGEFDSMTQYGIQAARNMQSHFADFLFEPFADGTRSMGDQFSATLRRMMAEAASSKLFEVIGTWASGYSGTGSGIINTIGSMIQGSGKREYGGSVFSRGMYQVGERNKPELLSTPNGQYLIPGDNGRVDPIRAAPAARGPAMSAPQIKLEVINNGQPMQATASQTTQPDGTQFVRLILDVVSDDVNNGGQTWAAMKARGGLKDLV